MKLPIKDRDTIPWMSPREIPAIRLVLSTWRRMRKCPGWSGGTKIVVQSISDLPFAAKMAADYAAGYLEELTAIDERMRKEGKHADA